jgi:hypothetical protein
VQNVAFAVHHGDHELVGRKQVVGLLDMRDGDIQEVPVGGLPVGQFRRSEADQVRPLFPTDPVLPGTQMRSFDFLA